MRTNIILIIILFFFINCSNNELIHLDEFKFFNKDIYGDSLYIINNYGIPDTIKTNHGSTFWQYEYKDAFISFEKDKNFLKANIIYIYNYSDSILSINKFNIKEEDYNVDNFFNLFGKSANGYNVADSSYTGIWFDADNLSDTVILGPVIYFENKKIVEIHF